MKLSLNPMGPGFFIFFQNEEEHFVGTGPQDISRRKSLRRRLEEEEIMMVIKKFLEVEG
jgi:hypothetical protein